MSMPLHPLPSRTASTWLVLAVGLLLGALPGLAHAAEQDPLTTNLPPSDPRSHISSLLRAYIDQAAGQVRPGIDPHLLARGPRAHAAGRVVLRLDSDTSAPVLAAIQATGATIRGSSARWNSVTVEATLGQIDALARVAGVHAVVLARRPWLRGNPQPGTYTNEADAVIHTNTLRNNYSTSGAGRTIGIISDSLNMTSFMDGGTESTATPSILTGTQPQIVHNLPTSIEVVYYGNPADQPTDTDEGESMMEEAYHLASGATFAFGACGDVDTDMATTIEQLQSEASCSVIGDDVGFPDEPMFQDGPIAQAAEAVVTGGGIYAAAAGNDDNQGIIMPFADVIPGEDDPQSNGTPNAKDLQNWGIGGATPGFLPIVVEGGDTVDIVLEWNQPYQSWGLGQGSQADFDLYLTSGTSFANILTSSTDTQGSAGAPAGDPLEIVEWSNPSQSNATIYVAVDHVRGLTSSLLRLEFHAGGYITSPNYSTVFGAGTCFGHPAAVDVLGVGAVDYSTPTIPEPYTAEGGWGATGLPFYFDTSGNPLAGAPLRRNKPDITAPDGCTVSNPDFDQFYGTSGATPHVLASAELAWTVRPSLSNFQILNALRGTCADITASPASIGPDAWTGFGLVNAYVAAGVPITSVSTTDPAGTYEVGTIPIQVAFAAPVTVSGTPTFLLNTTPARSATYVSGSGTTTLTFDYTVVQGDMSANLAPAGLQALTQGGGSINDTTADQNPADTALPASISSRDQPAFISSGAPIVIDAAGPTVTISGTPALSNQASFTFTITFSHAVTSFGMGNLSLSSNATPGTLSTVSAGLVYSLPVTATAQGTITLAVPADTVVDADGYGNSAGSGTVVYDTTPPTLTISAPSDTLTTGQDLTLTFTFSESVTGFSAADVAVTGGSVVGGFSGSGAVYSEVVTSGTPGTMTVSVPAGSATDLAGNVMAVPASLAVTVANPPASSSKKCGLSGIFGMMVGLGLWRWRRRRSGSAA